MHIVDWIIIFSIPIVLAISAVIIWRYDRRIQKIIAKLKEYENIFGDHNVRLVFFTDGTGHIEVGAEGYPGHFLDSFENVGEYLKKDPAETHRNVIKWGWIEK